MIHLFFSLPVLAKILRVGLSDPEKGGLVDAMQKCACLGSFKTMMGGAKGAACLNPTHNKIRSQTSHPPSQASDENNNSKYG